MANTVSIKPKKFKYFIGIDVSRNELDYAVILGKKLLFHKEAKNDPKDILSFVTELKLLPNFTISKSVFCMENTGIYCNHLLACLKKVKANIVMDNALQIRNSLGVIRNKYDKIDAIRIAQYASKCADDLRLWSPRRPIVLQLSYMVALRNRMLGIQSAFKVPLKEQKAFVTKGIVNQSIKLCKKSVDAIRDDLEEVDKTIDLLIASDKHLDHIFKIITSVPNIGRITAIQIIISTNEYKDIRNPKKFACYAGVAPFRVESGIVKRKAKISSLANKKVKALLHICAMGAIRCNKELKDYYIRKTQGEGKPKMAVINAVRNKLILRVFACLSQDRHYEDNYHSKNEIKICINE